MEDQLSKIKAAFTEINAAQGSLNSALGKHDVDFLVHYLPAFQCMEKVLSEEDRSLQRTVSYKDIPFYIPQSITEDLRKLGAVGGGTVPFDIEVEVSNIYSNLLQLNWQIPHNANEVQCYEIEYENLPNSMSGGSCPWWSRVQSDCYYDTEPQSIVIPGNVLASYVQDICPGYRYRFRIRSQNVAGWGMWSSSIVATCEPFLVWIKGTKRIHRIRIPKDGFYRLTAKGAKGANGKVHCGGRGAIVSGTFYLRAGDVLIVLVGTMSTMSVCNTGGGGGSFIAVNEIAQSSLLIAAGGGGGTRGLEEQDKDGCDANLDTSGTDGVGKEHGKGGTGGGPGEDANSEGFSGPCWGYGGAGFLQNSSSARSFIEGGTGGQYGGFGGGGAVGLYGGGGGGGYSGGGGGRGGGGGGSYVRDDALNVSKVVGNESHGEVEIDVVAPPSQNQEVWSGEPHMNTNATPIPVPCGEGGGGDLLVSQPLHRDVSVVPYHQPQQQSSVPMSMSQQWQQQQQQQSSKQPPPPPHHQQQQSVQQQQDATRAQAFSAQFSHASTASNMSGAPLQSESSDISADAAQPPPGLSGDLPQQQEREAILPIHEEVFVKDTTILPLGTANNALLNYPDLKNAPEILPAVSNVGTTNAPAQQPLVTTHTGQSPNASNETSPQQTTIHPNTNATPGTT